MYVLYSIRVSSVQAVSTVFSFTYGTLIQEQIREEKRYVFFIFTEHLLYYIYIL